MTRRRFWQKPILNFSEEKSLHRKVTWLELFFDLFFVVSIAQLAHHLGSHPSWKNLGEFLVLFISVWWIWIGFTYYSERFESEGIETRIFTFALMIPVIGLAVFAKHGLSESFRFFAISYGSARFITLVLWLRAAIIVKEFRPTGFRYIVGFSCSLILVFISAFMESSFRYALYSIALAIDVLTPLTTVRQQAKLPRFSSSKLPERFGLFVIIVLGEMIVGIVNGLASTEHANIHQFIDTAAGIALGLSLWWIYFDFIGRRPPKAGMKWAVLWSYLHLPLVISIAASGALISNVVGHQELTEGIVKQFLSYFIGASLITMGILETSLSRKDDEPAHPVISPLIKLLCGGAATSLYLIPNIKNPSIFLAFMLLILFIPITYGLIVWFTQEIEDRRT